MMLINETLSATGSTGIATADYSSQDGSYSIGGTFVATIDLERSLDNGLTWEVIASHTAATDPTVDNTNIAAPAAGTQFRLTCSAYTSGSAVCKLRV